MRVDDRNLRPRLVALATLILLVGLIVVILNAGLPRWRIASEVKPGAGYFLAVSFGVLEASVNLDGSACLWLQHDSDRTALYWPFGYTAGGWPVSVFDASGHRLGRAGDRVRIGGGQIPVRTITGCSGFQQLWAAAPGPISP